MTRSKIRTSGADGLTLSSTDVTVASGDLLFGTADKGVVLGVTSNTDSNTIDADIDVDLATNYMDIDGDSNTIDYDGDGYQGGYFYLDHTGNSRTINVTQASTLDNDWLRIISNGSSGTFCIIQNDQGTSTSC